MQSPRPPLDVDTAAERLKVVDATLRLANRPVVSAGLSWAKTSIAVTWICVAAYVLERDVSVPVRWAMLASMGAVLSYVVWHEVQRYKDLRRAPNPTFRNYTRVGIAAAVFGGALLFGVEARWVDAQTAACLAFLAVGGAYFMYGPFLRHGAIWLAVFSLPWLVAAILVFVTPRAELLLIAALACVLGGVVPGLIVHRRAKAMDWTSYGPDRESL